MRKNNIFARIIAAGDGRIYMILKNFQCCDFTAVSFGALMKDPMRFMLRESKKHVSRKGYPAPLRGDIMDIPGLTMGVLTDERKFHCEHPELIYLALLHANKEEATTQLDLHDLFEAESILDRKQWCIEVYLALGEKQTAKLRNEMFKMSEDTQSQILTEILHSRFSELFGQAEDSSDESNEHEKTLTEENGSDKHEPGIEENPPAEDDPDIPFTLCNPPAQQEKAPERTPPKFDKEEDGIPSHYIKIWEFARRYDVTETTIHRWIKEQWITSCLKDSKGRWWLDSTDTPEKIRERNLAMNKTKKRTRAYYKGNTYQDLQNYIRDNNLFSDKIRKYIRSYEELRYYLDNGYKEVDWFGNSALVINIFLDYYSERQEETNRSRINDGRSPVVPDLEGFPAYDLHHIGQKEDSPLAIIPSNIHNSAEMYSVFHSGVSDANIHSAKFDLQRRKFWLMYVQQCDLYGGYEHIPNVNSKKTKK